MPIAGVRFDQFYVASPVCSPSRAALLTGRTPQRAGLTTNAGDRGLPTGQLTLAELFRHAGYRTALFGKWHLGKLPESDPLGQGFEEFFGHLGGCIDNYSHFFYWHGPNRHDLWRNRSEHFEDGAYFPDLVVREANRFLGENQDNPFFLYLPFNTPHYPLQAEREFVAMYADMKDEKRRRYAPFVTSLDAKIGAVLARLDELGLREETLVLFLSDHGHSVEERTFGGGRQCRSVSRAQGNSLGGGGYGCRASSRGRERSRRASCVSNSPPAWTFCRPSASSPVFRFPSTGWTANRLSACSRMTRRFPPMRSCTGSSSMTGRSAKENGSWCTAREELS